MTLSPPPKVSPSPSGSSSPKATPAEPAPAVVTKTVVVTPPPNPDDVPLTDHLQGWGTVLAVVVALIVAIYGWKRESAQRTEDQQDAEEQREKDRADAELQRTLDRADADRRLQGERRAADKRLQTQLDAQRERDKKDFLIGQLQRVGDLYAEHQGMQRTLSAARFLASDHPERTYVQRVAAQRLRTYLPVLPSPYASLLKAKVFGDSSHLIDEQTRAEAVRRAPDPSGDGIGPFGDEEVYMEIADNIAELLDSAEESWMRSK